MKYADIKLTDFIAGLAFLGYRLVIICGAEDEPCQEEPECINECCCEAPQEIENPFIAKYLQEKQEFARLGVSDLISWERDKIRWEAEKYIKDNNITDEDEALKIHHRTRDHYLEYRDYLKKQKEGC